MFFQETHSTKDLEDYLSVRTRGELIMSHGNSKSRGTAILFGKNLDYSMQEQILDKNGRFVIVLATIQGNNFLLVNLYLPNYEHLQVSVMKSLIERLTSDFDIPIDTKIVWGGDFNFIFDSNLDSSGENPILKTTSIETIQEIMLEWDLCEIWRLRNPSSKIFTWSGVGQGKKSDIQKKNYRRLDFFLISDFG